MKININKIVEIGKNVNILGMGEATHGQHKISVFRANVFKALVKKAGYNVFVLEEQYSSCKLINNYINCGIGRPKSIMKKSFMKPWQSEELLNLIKWMKRWNNNHSKKIQFIGIDVQYICENYNKKSKIDKWIKKCVEKLSDTGDQYTIFRDRKMYKLFLKLYNKNNKYFCWFHNYHLSKLSNKTHVTMGSYLSKKFKSKYYVIFNSFNTGTFWGKLENKPGYGYYTVKKSICKPIIKNNSLLLYNKNFNNITIIEGGWFIGKDNVYCDPLYDTCDALICLDKETPLKVFSHLLPN